MRVIERTNRVPRIKEREFCYGLARRRGGRWGGGVKRNLATEVNGTFDRAPRTPPGTPQLKPGSTGWCLPS